MRINQNLAAFNAYRNLSRTQDRLQGSLEKLSSGFRINRAADDASGLANSENLRAQIGGMKVANRNAQDAISMVQTAEAAMGEVHAILHRMRDLVVEAGNVGPNDATALKANQDEITQLTAELDRIASDTQFGTKRILDGTFSGTGGDVVSGLTVSGVSTPAPDGGARDTQTVNATALWAGMTELTTGGHAAEGYAGNITLTFNSTTVTGGPGEFSVDVAVGASAQDIGVAIQAELSRLAAEDVPADPSTSAWAGIGVSFNLTNNAFTLTAGDNAHTWGTITADTAPGTGAVFQIGANTGQRASVAFASVFASDLGTGVTDLTNAWTSVESIRLSGEGAALEDAVDDALNILDRAILQVSSSRAELGAFQNRMESAARNAAVAVENLSAAESRIRDTDMALEMVEFTRTQILSQAGTAMLSQANVVPQSVLSLLG